MTATLTATATDTVTGPASQSFKRRLAAGEAVLGTFVQMGEPSVVDVLASSGFGFAIADLEHGGLDLRQAVDLVRSAHVHGFPLLARVPLPRLVEVGQLLDSGFTGILAPQVATADDARRAVAAARFPPTGERGACQGTRSDRFGTWAWPEHVAGADATTVVVVAVESAAGAAATAEICAVEGVDAIFIGVFDLAASMGLPGQIDHPDVVATVDAVAAAARSRGVPVGAWSRTVAGAAALLRKGLTFLPVSTDVLLWSEACHGITHDWRARAASATAPTEGER